jgi:hypothetical protein
MVVDAHDEKIDRNRCRAPQLIGLFAHSEQLDPIGFLQERHGICKRALR